MGENNIVDLRKEKERREREQREALRAVVRENKEDDDQGTNTDDGTGEKGESPAPKPESKPQEKPKPREKPEALFAWDALEYVEHPKQKEVWTRNTWLITLPLAALMLLTKNVLGAATIVIGAFAFLVNAFRPPRKLHYAIQKKGVSTGERFYSYDSLESFWIFSEDEDKVLSLRRKAMLQYALHLPLGDADSEKIREALKPHLPEEEQEPSAMEAFLRRIGY